VVGDPALPPGIGRVLITSAELSGRVRELGRSLERDYAGRVPLLVGVLNGAAVFVADLMRAIAGPVECDFVAVSSYGRGTRSQGVVTIRADLLTPIAGRDVVIVEDVVDTGRTLAELKEMLEARGPRSVRTCALLDKRERREVAVDVDYVGFTIPGQFVVGYGLDLAGLHRNLPYIATVAEPGRARSRRG
jgi:hypoxanthine phosphoribosyltransferase